MDYTLLFWKCVILLVFHVTVILSDDHEYRLIRDLMRDYDQRVRPSLNASNSLNVTFGLALAQIIDVDEKNQIITTNCWLNQAWVDYKLQWDPAEYGGIKVIRIPYDTIWRPDIVLYNNADVTSHKTSISTNVIVTSDGNITWLSMVIFRSSCAIDVRYFPFDQQQCSMLFASWAYDGFQINLQKVGEKGDTTNYLRNGEWLLLKLEAVSNIVYYSCCAEPYPDVTYTIHIRRKPLFYVFNMMLPCILITLVALLGFYIPADTGEKVTMGITTLLSMTVFLMLVAESMPPTSDVLPLIGIYYGVTIGIVSFSTAMTAFTLNIHHKGLRGKEVPPWLKKICFAFLARILLLTIELPEASYDGMRTHHSENGEGRRSSYVKMKKSSKRSNSHSQMSHSYEASNTRMTVLDFVPAKDFSQKDRFEMQGERLPENGGLSPRFSTRLRNPSSQGSPSSNDFERQFLRVLQKVYQTIEKNEMRLAEQDRREVIKNEWQQVAIVVDRLLLFLFLITTIGVTLGIMFRAPHAKTFLFGINYPNHAL